MLKIDSTGGQSRANLDYGDPSLLPLKSDGPVAGLKPNIGGTVLYMMMAFL